jgi:hypothetical protein
MEGDSEEKFWKGNANDVLSATGRVSLPPITISRPIPGSPCSRYQDPGMTGCRQEAHVAKGNESGASLWWLD